MIKFIIILFLLLLLKTIKTMPIGYNYKNGVPLQQQATTTSLLLIVINLMPTNSKRN
jgi:hypothetical protein